MFGVKLYQGFENNKLWISIVERNDGLEIIKYAYKHEGKII